MEVSHKTLWVLKRADFIRNPEKRKSVIETRSNRSSVSSHSKTPIKVPINAKKNYQKTKSISDLPDISNKKGEFFGITKAQKEQPKTMVFDRKYNPDLPSIEQLTADRFLNRKEYQKYEDDLLSPSDLFESPLIKKRLVHSKKLDNNNSTVLSCRFNPDEDFVALGCEDGITRVIDLTTTKLYKLKNEIDVPVTSVRFHPTKSLLLYVTKANGIVEIWDVDNSYLTYSFSEEDNFIFCSDHSLNGNLFATAGQDAHIRVYDNERPSKPAYIFSRLSNPTHANRIYSVKFHEENSNLIVSGGWDETLIIWDIRTSHTANFIYGPLICGDSLDLSHDEILTGSWRENKQVQIWDLRTLKEKQCIEWKNDGGKEKPFVYSCVFEKKKHSMIFVGSSGVNEIKVYENGNKYECLDKEYGFKKGIYSLDAGKNKSHIVYACERAGIYSYY